MGREAWSFMVLTLCLKKKEAIFRSETNCEELGYALTCQANLTNTGHLRSSNSSARTLGQIEHKSMGGFGDPCPGFAAGAVWKIALFVFGQRKDKLSLPMSLLVGFRTMKGRPGWFPVSNPIKVDLTAITAFAKSNEVTHMFYINYVRPKANFTTDRKFPRPTSVFALIAT